MFVQDEGMDKKELMRLQEEGQNLADKIMVCMFCDDPYSPERVLSPLLLHRACFLTGDRSIVIETFLGDSKRKVEVRARASYEESFQINVVYALYKCASSPGSFLRHRDLPQGLQAEGRGYNIEFPRSDAVQRGAYTWLYTHLLGQAESQFSDFEVSWSAAFYTPFFKEVWEKKGEIERAFRMEQPHNLPDVATARPNPPPHDRHAPMEHKLTNSLDLLIGPDSRADIDSETY
ncbi:hypothetical protein MSG28_011531 [Choristoneura fumiferana]|uniref:Uncharacterized protein n=1 Tax=Choristoneura fumiferana TaxID=7141 RepID=A0ACC0JNN0_CHOFU|nr:hypothetical protein MSG28_011531 [Choristoneura fumiferana]